MWLVDPKTRKKSVTLTAFTVGFAVATFKLLVSGVQIGTIHLDTFSGTDFAAVCGALGAIYVFRRSKNQKEK